MKKIKLYNTHCCGEIGDVVVSGKINLKGNTILEQSKYLFDDKKLRKFLLNEPRGCLLYTSPSPRDRTRSRMPSSA